MPGPDALHAWWVCAAAVPLAYVGPGADLNLIGYTLTLLSFAVTAISAVLLWPVYTLARWLRGGKKKAAPAPPVETTSGEPRADDPPLAP